MPLEKPMNTGMKDGKLVIDMAEADELWEGMSQDQQYEMMCIMFEPIMQKATKMHRALSSIMEAAESRDTDACYELARLALQ